MKSSRVGLVVATIALAVAGRAEAGSLTFSATVTSGSLDGTDLQGRSITGSVEYELIQQTAMFGPAFWGVGEVTLNLDVAGKSFILSNPQAANEYFFAWPNNFGLPGEVSLSFSDPAQHDSASLDIHSPVGPAPNAPGVWWLDPSPYSSGTGSADLGPSGEDGHIQFQLGPPTPEPSSLVLGLVGVATVAGCVWRRRRRPRD